MLKIGTKLAISANRRPGHSSSETGRWSTKPGAALPGRYPIPRPDCSRRPAAGHGPERIPARRRPTLSPRHLSVHSVHRTARNTPHNLGGPATAPHGRRHTLPAGATRPVSVTPGPLHRRGSNAAPTRHPRAGPCSARRARHWAKARRYGAKPRKFFP